MEAGKVEELGASEVRAVRSPAGPHVLMKASGIYLEKRGHYQGVPATSNITCLAS